MRPSTTPTQTSARTSRGSIGAGDHPLLFTVDEAATLLRTTRRAIYAMVERRHLPGVIRIRRRVLFKAVDLLDWLDRKSAPSPKE